MSSTFACWLSIFRLGVRFAPVRTVCGHLFLPSAMPWLILIIAGLLEVSWAIGLKYTHGFTRLWPSAGTVIALIASVYLLAVAAKSIPIGTAYAVWTGIGALGAVILGIVLFKEPAAPLRILFLCTLLGSIVGLKLTAGAAAVPPPTP